MRQTAMTTEDQEGAGKAMVPIMLERHLCYDMKFG
jgi:hypothetical protein